MTSSSTESGTVVPPERPEGEPVALYTPEFAANPGYYYDKMRRQYGAIAPVELAPGVPASLVLGYEAALEVLRSPETFPRDPRRWEATIPADNPILPIMQWRPTCQRSDGAEMARYRSAVFDGLSTVDLVRFRAHLERSADELIAHLAPKGKADLITEYIGVMLLQAVIYMFGCSPSSANRLAMGTLALATAVVSGDPIKGNEEFTQCVFELIAEHRADPRPGIISRLMAHPARLTDEELAHQLVTLAFAAIEPETVVIANALLLFLSDDRFSGDLAGGSLPVEDAIEEVMWADTGVNLAQSYPREDLVFHGLRLPADQPVLISFTAANQDPSLPRDHSGNRAHITWGVGPHSCPAQEPARMIATVIIERLLDGLPDMRLAISTDQLTWRISPVYHTLTALPVEFSPMSVRPDQQAPESSAADLTSDDSSVSPSAPHPVPPAAQPKPAQRLWDLLVKWWDGR